MVSPDENNKAETTSTLTFGSNARQVSLGQAKKNIKQSWFFNKYKLMFFDVVISMFFNSFDIPFLFTCYSMPAIPVI